MDLYNLCEKIQSRISGSRAKKEKKVDTKRPDGIGVTAMERLSGMSNVGIVNFAWKTKVQSYKGSPLGRPFFLHPDFTKSLCTACNFLGTAANIFNEVNVEILNKTYGIPERNRFYSIILDGPAVRLVLTIMVIDRESSNASFFRTFISRPLDMATGDGIRVILGFLLNMTIDAIRLSKLGQLQRSQTGSVDVITCNRGDLSNIRRTESTTVRNLRERFASLQSSA